MLSSETCCWKAGTAASFVGDRAELGQDTAEASSTLLGLGVGSPCGGVVVASTL